MLLLQTLLLSLISVAAADVSCASEIPAATCSALAAGAPLEPRHATLNCNKITGVLGVLKGLAGPATSFCSSYLGVPTATTVRTTVTPAPRLECFAIANDKPREANEQLIQHRISRRYCHQHDYSFCFCPKTFHRSSSRRSSP